MIFWIKKFARIIAFSGFVIIFLCGIDIADPFNGFTLAAAFLKGLCGGAILWFTGFIICDILLKGAVEDIPEKKLDKLEGGLIQRIHETKEEPLISEIKEDKPKNEKK